jgi:hypothetical protein
MTRKTHPADSGTNAPVDTPEARSDESRDELRRELKSGQYDPNTAHQPQEVRKHPTEGERMQFGQAAPGVVPDGDAILPDHGKPVPESLPRDRANHGVLDPAEVGHPLPEGLERTRAGPLNKDTGRRIKGGGGGA